jgi:hypothetical protein
MKRHAPEKTSEVSLAEKPGERQAEGRKVSNHEQGKYHNCVKRQHRTGHPNDIAIADPGSYEEAGAYWWGQQTNAEVGNHNNSEVNWIDSQSERDWQKYRGKNQHSWRHIHEYADSQERKIDDQQDYQRI